MRSLRGRRLARARRLQEQRDRLFGVQQVFEEETLTNSVVAEGTAHERLDIDEDLEICDELPRPLRRCLHELVCSFSSAAVRSVLHRPQAEILLNLREHEKRDVHRFHAERGLTYVGTICRYNSRRVYKRAAPGVRKVAAYKETKDGERA